jgi:cysteinyl-tRNA synthetase
MTKEEKSRREPFNVQLHLHNTLTRKKDPFEPLDPARVGMYVCGPTVYSRAHIGNARPVVVFDVLYRLLKRLYPSVVYVRNITDVDDKINKRAAENGETIAELTAKTTKLFHQDIAALNALPPDFEPRATAHISQMIAMIQMLIERGHAYVAEGHALFDTQSMAAYGRLSGRSLDEMIAGARVDVAPYKRNPADFVLWKPSTPDLPGWDSPWGRGRPGWHIECSAMAKEYLGVTFDIHGGGQDLIFPHHENELSQSVCAHGGSPFARYWVHNGHLVTEGEKMSKSLGNIVTVHELLDEAPGEAVRLAMLSTHYHQPLDWTAEGLRHARGTLDRLYQALRATADIRPEYRDEIPAEVLGALCDDLNTPLAIAHLHELATRLNKSASPAAKAENKGALLAAGDLLGLLQQDPEQWFRWHAPSAGGTVATLFTDTKIEAMIQERLAARKAKNWAESDRIRDELKAAGVILEDGPKGTTWRRGG